MEVESRGKWRRRLVAFAVLCAGAAMWAGVAFGGSAGGSEKNRGGAAQAKKVVKRSHVMRMQSRAHDGNCPFSHSGGASAQV